MSRSIGWLAAATAAMICGCASADRTARSTDYDVQKVAQIDSLARARGVDVYWVNYPQRKARSEQVTPSLGEPSGT